MAAARAARGSAASAASAAPAASAPAASAVRASPASASSASSARASAVRAASAASASAASAAGYAATRIWQQVRNDARVIAAGEDPFATRLWSIPEFQWLRESDTRTRAIWQRDNPDHWVFWTRWWDGVLPGDQIDWRLQEAVALIPDDVWQAGPGAVAMAIEEREAQFRKEAAISQAEALLNAALADYSFDAIHRVMRMVPFEGDISHLRDPARLAAFLDDADAIRDDLELFSRALAAEGAMQHAGFVRTYLDGVLDEFSRARQMTHLRVGRVVELGKILEEYASSQQVAAEFGPAIHALRGHVQGLLALTRRHFSATLTRMAPLRDLSTGPGDNQWDLLQDIQRGINQMTAPTGGLPPLGNEDRAVLLSMVDSIERVLRQNEVVSSPQARSRLRREVDFGLALLSVSVALYVERAKAEDHGPGKVLDWIASQQKRTSGVAWLVGLIRSLLEKG